MKNVLAGTCRLSQLVPPGPLTSSKSIVQTRTLASIMTNPYEHKQATRKGIKQALRTLTGDEMARESELLSLATLKESVTDTYKVINTLLQDVQALVSRRTSWRCGHTRRQRPWACTCTATSCERSTRHPFWRMP